MTVSTLRDILSAFPSDLPVVVSVLSKPNTKNFEIEPDDVKLGDFAQPNTDARLEVLILGELPAGIK
jgi:hypothetical protein